MNVYLNDRIVPEEDANVSIFDHGFLYGDGIYETMRSYGGVVFMLDEHLKRLFRSASLIELEIPKSEDEISKAIYDTLNANDLADAYVRVSVTRGSGALGLDPALCEEPTFVIIAGQLTGYPESYYEMGVKMIIPRTRRNMREALDPRIKSHNFLNNILAKIEAIKAGAFEALMLNATGKLTECTVSNVFFLKGDALCTPSVECGILDGITRQVVIHLARRIGIEMVEGEFETRDIYAAREVFVTNTTMEVMPVRSVDDREYEVGDVSRLLLEAYRKNVAGKASSERL